MYAIDFYRTFFQSDSKRIKIFFLIDGMGMNLIRTLPENTWLAKNVHREMTSVYPSTTAVALSSLASFREPQELGVTGWTTWIQELNVLAQVLPSTFAGNKQVIPDLVTSCLKVPSAMAEMDLSYIGPKEFVGTPYQRWTLGGKALSHHHPYNTEETNGWYNTLVERTNQLRGGEIIYVYYPKVDSLSHDHGWDSEQVRQTILTIDSLLQKFTDVFAGHPIDLCITADHGLVNINRENYHIIDELTPWMEFLQCPFTGEGRNPVFHVKPGKEKTFQRVFQQRKEGSGYSLKTPEQLLEQGLFRNQPFSDHVRSRWGTFVGLAQKEVCLEYCPAGKKPFNFIGVHGGNHSYERKVPLILKSL